MDRGNELVVGFVKAELVEHGCCAGDAQALDQREGAFELGAGCLCGFGYENDDVAESRGELGFGRGEKRESVDEEEVCVLLDGFHLLHDEVFVGRSCRGRDGGIGVAGFEEAGGELAIFDQLRGFECCYAVSEALHLAGQRGDEIGDLGG